MTVKQIKDDVVASIVYTLTVDGEEIEHLEEDDAIEYLHGAGNIVPGLEVKLTGKRIGDGFGLILKPEDAYGEHDEALIEQIPREDFEGVDALRPGMEVELESDDGYLFDVTIREITDEVVVVDFNPPLAGKTLDYNVKVVGLRAATEEELETGIPASLVEALEHSGSEIEE